MQQPGCVHHSLTSLRKAASCTCLLVERGDVVIVGGSTGGEWTLLLQTLLLAKESESLNMLIMVGYILLTGVAPLLCVASVQVLRPPAPPCQELQEEEVRPHQPAAPQEEAEVNYFTPSP